MASIATGLIPLVGDVKDVMEVIEGRDRVAGEDLAGWERGVTVIGAFIPFLSGSAVRTGVKSVVTGAGTAAGWVKGAWGYVAGKFWKSADKVDEAGDTLDAINKGRKAYIAEVEGLRDVVDTMRSAGNSPEEIARKVSAMRRQIGEKYISLTPPDRLEDIYQRNLAKYGDKLGPTIDWLREVAKKSWDDIIESATRSGGGDLGF